MGRILRWAAVPAVAATALLASSSVLASHTRAAGQGFTVNVDSSNKAPGQNESFLSYFPAVTKVHAGDSVTFHYVGPGEPHTVTFGTLVNNAVSLAHKYGKQLQGNGPPPAPFLAADSQIPGLLPQGPGDAVQSAANPCYQASGPVGTATCPLSQHEEPDFTGTYAYYNSGWLQGGQKWTIHLSSSTAPGTYAFMCLLHREFMSGALKVVPSSTTVASPAAQFAAGQKTLASGEAQLVAAAQALAKGEPPVPNLKVPGQNPVIAGSGNPQAQISGDIDEFGPKVVKIPVGGSVTWYVIGVHTITFNSNKTNDDIHAVAPDGTQHINVAAASPAGGPGEPAPPKTIPPKGFHFKVTASSSWNGSGFHNSGIFANSSPPGFIEGYKLTFTKGGTYHYICTVHDFMKGTVIVGSG
jgi:plastocyanin